jgi:hypothetical protein
MAPLGDLGAKMSQYLLSKMPAEIHIKDFTPHENAGQEYDVKSDDVIVEFANIAFVEPTEPHRQQGFMLRFSTPVDVTGAPEGEDSHTLSLSEVQLRLADVTADGETAAIATSEPLVKAGWNYFLFHGDGSQGVHNASLSIDAMCTAIEALTANMPTDSTFQTQRPRSDNSAWASPSRGART